MRKGGQLIFFAGIFLFLFMLSSLLMMSNALQDSSHFSEIYLGLLIFNTLGLLVLVVLISVNLRRLIQQLQKRLPGARMTVRMVTMFTILSVTPVLIVYYFSLDFLIRGIDNWFDLRVEQALDDSLELSRLSLDRRMRELLKKTEQAAEKIAMTPEASIPFDLDELRVQAGAKEFTLLTRQGGIIASSSDDPTRLVPERPSETILLQLQQGNSYAGLDTIRNTGLSIRVVVNVPETNIASETRIIQGLFTISERINQLANSVQNSFVKYKELAYLREQLKKSFVIVLTLVLLFSIFSTVWAAFYSARLLAEPVRNLAKGTRAVADGNYDTQLPVPSNDELGFLVASFNDMTRKIALAQDEASRSRNEAEIQRSYLETVLSRLSSGVIVLDHNNVIRTANENVSQILGIPVEELIDHSFEEIAENYPYLDNFKKLLSANLLSADTDWREQISLVRENTRSTLMCSGTILPPSHNIQQGHVIVIDDITAVIQGQRNATWSDMARRLAHEIKNPLTPIQLATERLRQRYRSDLDKEEADKFDRLTNTIIQQVETMKDMVNSFTDFSRIPEINLQTANINSLVSEVVDLYSNLNQNTEIITKLADDLPLISVDKSRLRQVFNNLIKNALDACEKSRTSRLEISTEYVREKHNGFVEIKIKDSGMGLPEDIMDQVFEPYTTTKAKGTGLGLAIAKKIVEEHRGIIWVENNPEGHGASAIVRLPVAEIIDQVSEQLS